MKNLKQFREDSGYAAKIKAKKELKLKKGTTLKIMPQVPEKPDKALGVKEGNESCSEGNYYCFDEKKCKPIPKGTKVGKDGMLVKEGKRGLWDNIHAKRKRGEKPAKKGDKDYPKTLKVEGSLAQAKRNIGRDPKKKTCWKGYRAQGTKMKGGKSVPNCVPA